VANIFSLSNRNEEKKEYKSITHSNRKLVFRKRRKKSRRKNILELILKSYLEMEPKERANPNEHKALMDVSQTFSYNYE
jgi:hypothetical protein